MTKHKILVPASKCWRITPLKPITTCSTRWGSVYELMYIRKRLSTFIKSMDDDDIIDLAPNNGETKSIEDLCEVLSQFNSVTKRFQAKDNTIADVWTILGDVIEKYNDKTRKDGCNRILPSSYSQKCNRQYQKFKMDGHEDNLTKIENVYVSQLLKAPNVTETDIFSSLPLMEQVIKCRRCCRNDRSAYLDLPLSTTNV